MGTETIDPQSIRNVTIIGDPDETTGVAHRLLRFAGPGSGAATTVRWATGRVDHTIRIAELSTHAPLADLQRRIRVADGVIAVANAAVPSAPLATTLRVADDHQVARMCLVTGLDQPAADFDRCVRAIADTRGAVPLTLQLPLGTGPEFGDVIDLLTMWALEPMAEQFYGNRWQDAERRYRELVAAVTEDPAASNLEPRAIPPEQLHHRIRRLTHLGEAVPVLCDATPTRDDVAPLLDAIVRYLPSPMHVCQPEHALDY
ncbi:hypothetical protein [Nocardia mexicana]|uniref:Elongation factor G n=1 Tax=Nocardia mexicana TaxID=279262 RepID=A0A370GNL3_9NOCA|nr:hypothetical protein [Nocardia mexicana]RDI44919.1 elongation factor G [Nocardia mexicana]